MGIGIPHRIVFIAALVLAALAAPASAQQLPAAAPADGAAEVEAPKGPPIGFDWRPGLRRQVAMTHESSSAAGRRQLRLEMMVEGDEAQRNVLFLPETGLESGLGFDEIRITPTGELREGANVAAAATFWDSLVLRWRGRPLSLGMTVEERAIMPVMLGIPTSGVHELRFQGRVPCAGSAPGAEDCVHLISIVKPDPPALRELIAYVVNRVGQSSGEVPVENVQSARLEMRSDLVTDPDTLVPSRLTTVFSLDATIRDTGQVRHFDRYVFEFRPAAAAQ